MNGPVKLNAPQALPIRSYLNGGLVLLLLPVPANIEVRVMNLSKKQSKISTMECQVLTMSSKLQVCKRERKKTKLGQLFGLFTFSKAQAVCIRLVLNDKYFAGGLCLRICQNCGIFSRRRVTGGAIIPASPCASSDS